MADADATPHDLALERALLAMVLADNAALDKLERLEPEHFFDAVHREVFAAARDLRRERRPVNLVTLGGLVGGDPLGASVVLDSLKDYSFAGTMPDPQDMADSLIDLAGRREVQALGEWLAGSVWNYRTPRADLIEQALRELDRILARTRGARRSTWTAAELLDDMMRAVQSDDAGNRIATGFADLDRMTGGWRRGEFAILAGRPSMGKSAIAVCAATNAAKAGHGVLIFSLEMTGFQWAARMASEAAYSGDVQVPYAAAIRRQLSERDLDRFLRAARLRQGLPLILDEQAGLSSVEIAARTRRAAQEFERDGKRLGLVVVDHLGKVRPSSHYRGNRVQEMGEISNSMAQLAKAEGVAVLALHQLNRAVEGRDNKRPSLADLRDSGNLEQDADTVMFAFRPAYYLERAREEDAAAEQLRRDQLEATRHDLEIIIAKNRNGPTGTVDLFCDMASNVVCNKDRVRRAA
jgi:replicative DNA helicase